MNNTLSSVKERLAHSSTYLKNNKGTVLKYLIAGTIAFVWIVPFLGLFMAAIRPYNEIVYGWWHFENLTLTVQHFVDAITFNTAPMGTALVNSAIVTLPATVLTVALGAMIAYPLARFNFIGRKTLFFIIILIMTAPGEIIAMTNYQTMRAIGLFDTYIGLILIHAAWGLGWVVLFFRNYMLTIPIEMEEAARVDGASRFEIFKSVILPLAGPAIVSVAVIQFTWIWNAALFPMIFMRGAESYLAPQALPLLKGRIFVHWGRLSAACVLTMAVPVIIYILLQRYYTRGLTGGAIRK